MVRQRSPLNKETTPGSKPYAHIAHSAARKVRPGIKLVKEKKPLYYLSPKKNPIYRKRAHRLTLDGDTTLFEPMAAAYSDDDSNQRDEESSEGEDWDEGTLVHAFDSTEPKSIEDRKVSLVESLKVPFEQAGAVEREELKQEIVGGLDRIRDKHYAAAGPKGSDRRVQDGAYKFAEYTPKYVQGIVQAQGQYEQGYLKCQTNTVNLMNQLQEAYEKKHQSRVDSNIAFHEKAQKTGQQFGTNGEAIDALEAIVNKRLKAIAKIDNEKNLQSLFSLFT